MPITPAPLFSNGNFQLYHTQLQSTTETKWEISKAFPVSLFFYLKGAKASLEAGSAVVSKPFIVKNSSRFLFHDKSSVCLTWQHAAKVEFIEIRLKKEYLATLVAQEPKDWELFFNLLVLQKNILMPEKPLAMHKDFTHIINGIVSASLRPAFLRKTIFEAKALELLVAFLELLQQPKPYGPVLATHGKLAMLAKKYIDEYKGKKQFTIISLAKTLDTNETTLKQAFKSTYGKTIFRYFQEKNMQAAMEALQAGQSVAATATQCGYSYMSHFSFAFKKEFGVSPSKFL